MRSMGGALPGVVVFRAVPTLPEPLPFGRIKAGAGGGPLPNPLGKGGGGGGGAGAGELLLFVDID